MSEEKVRRESSEETPGSTQPIMELRDPAQGPAEVNDAEDKLHDAVVRLLDRVPDAAGIEDTNNYILKVLQNVCIDRWNSLSRLNAENSVSLDASKNDDHEQPIKELRDPARGPEMDTEIKIDNEKLLRSLESHCADLTKREKNLLALHLQGLSNDQIASALSEDVKTTRVDMNAVVAKIRYRLQHRDYDQSPSHRHPSEGHVHMSQEDLNLVTISASEFEQLSAKTAEILEAAAVAYKRLAKDQEEIEQLKTETREMLARLCAA